MNTTPNDRPSSRPNRARRHSKTWLIPLTALILSSIAVAAFFVDRYTDLNIFGPKSSDDDQPQLVEDSARRSPRARRHTRRAETRRADQSAEDQIQRELTQSEQYSEPNDRPSFDLAFHSLRGPVAYLKNEFGQEFYFDSETGWTNDTYEDTLTDRWWEFDSSGRRTAEHYTDTDGQAGTMYYHWSPQGRISSISDTKRGWTNYRYYDADGNLTNVEIHYDPDSGKSNRSISYSDYHLDSYGNWTSRRVGSQTQRRTIRYQ